MEKIQRSKPQWMRVMFLLVAIINPLLGLILTNPSQPIFQAGYLLLLILGLYLIIFRKAGWRQDFIQWDESAIVIRTDGVDYRYHWNALDELVIKKEHLYIKSGPAGGIWLDLKGYSKEDIQRLDQLFHTSNQQAATAV